MENPFEVGKHYQRRSTHVLHPTIVGGERVTYLVQAPGSQTLVSCWLNQEMDPHAPSEVWVEDTDRISERALRLYRQRSPVHVFMKKTKKDRLSKYLGEFQATEIWSRRTHPVEVNEREAALIGTRGERVLRHVLLLSQV